MRREAGETVKVLIALDVASECPDNYPVVLLPMVAHSQVAWDVKKPVSDTGSEVEEVVRTIIQIKQGIQMISFKKPGNLYYVQMKKFRKMIYSLKCPIT